MQAILPSVEGKSLLRLLWRWEKWDAPTPGLRWHIPKDFRNKHFMLAELKYLSQWNIGIEDVYFKIIFSNRESK